MDVNETELIQAVNVSGDRDEMIFVYADILASAVSGLRVDSIILASCLQYFDECAGIAARVAEASYARRRDTHYRYTCL